MGELFSAEKQYATHGQRADTIQDIWRRTEGNVIFIAGTAYQHHAVQALQKQGLSPEEALRRLIYRKDVDFFTDDVDVALRQLGDTYPRRFDEWAKHPNQRKREVGKIRLRDGYELDGRTVIPVYVGVDVTKDYYTREFPEDRKSKVVSDLKESSVETDLFGEPVLVEGLNNLVLSKLINLEASMDRSGRPIVYDKYASDAANLIYLYNDSIDFDYVADMLGGRDMLIQQLRKARDCLAGHRNLEDRVLKKLLREQLIPEPLEVSRHLLVADKSEELKALDRVIGK